MMDEKLKFLPKSGRVLSMVNEFVCLWREKPLTALDFRKSCARFHEWISDYTRPEILLMGFCAGGNLPEGSLAEIIKEYAKVEGVDDFELASELHEWLYGKRGDSKGVNYHMVRGDYKPVLDMMESESDDNMAFLYAVSIAAKTESSVNELIKRIEHAMEEGYAFG